MDITNRHGHHMNIARGAADQLRTGGLTQEKILYFHRGQLKVPSELLRVMPSRSKMQKLQKQFGGRFLDPLPTALDLATLAQPCSSPPQHFWAALSGLFQLGHDTVLLAGLFPDPKELGTIDEVWELLGKNMHKIVLLLDRLIPDIPGEFEKVGTAIRKFDDKMAFTLHENLKDLTAIMVAAGLPAALQPRVVPMSVSRERRASVNAIECYYEQLPAELKTPDPLEPNYERLTTLVLLNALFAAR